MCIGKYNIIPRILPKEMRFLYHLEALALVVAACCFSLCSFTCLKEIWIFSAISIFQSQPQYIQYSDLWDTPGIMLFTKDKIENMLANSPENFDVHIYIFNWIRFKKIDVILVRCLFNVSFLYIFQAKSWIFWMPTHTPCFTEELMQRLASGQEIFCVFPSKTDLVSILLTTFHWSILSSKYH